MKFHWNVDLSRIALDIQRVNSGKLAFYGVLIWGLWIGFFHRNREDPNHER